MKYCLRILAISLLTWSCNRPDQVPNNFADKVLVEIANLRDRRSGDSLLRYLPDKNPFYRYSAVMAFGSLQDSSYVVSLSHVLSTDGDSTVRIAAAYALGQTPSLKSEQALLKAASNEESQHVLAEIIQAYGKVSRDWQLEVSPVTSFLKEAIGWGYYRMAVRGLSDTIMNRKSAELLGDSALNARLAAAHYFARGAKDFQRFEKNLIGAFGDQSPDVRMAAVLALGKIISETSFNAALSAAETDRDYRVRVNAIKAIQNFPISKTKTALITALSDANVNVAIAASEAIKTSVTKDDWNDLLRLARATQNFRIQANLYEAAVSGSNRMEIVDEIKALYEKSTNAYKRAVLLTALQGSPMAYDYLLAQLLESKQFVIKSAAASALVSINRNKNFDRSMSRKFGNIYKQAIQDGDMAVIGIVCAALADSSLDYKSVVKDFSFLKAARNKLSLPRDYESVVPLDMAINYFEGKPSGSEPANDFNHPIPWHVVKKIPFDQKANIRTSKGDIRIQLFVNDAPGSVVNFVMLAAEKYYDGRVIHRVAPNFVVQDGCPRGDGWGSEAYSIRSEFVPRLYRSGAVGMASAGKDTEGTQWFITHSPTPHLEGRYTLFAEVESGMDVVHKLEVGDSVISVQIIDLAPI